MKPAQIVLLLVALLAGGLAAYLATRGEAPAPTAPVVQQVAEAPKTQVLVAKGPIGVAQRLTVGNVEWQDWPESALRDDYITIAAMPDAPTDLAGAVARFEIFPGEPIREVKLVHADQGYLSAVLEKGKRGVSIPISAASGSGGFIVPNDRVDVILTRNGVGGEVSETILSNVKVLAIGKRLGELGTTGGPADPADPKAQVFDSSTIATLELDPGQGETLVNAAAVGSLSLALRSVADFNDTTSDSQRPTNQPVRVIRYGQEASVVAAAVGEPAPVAVNPAAFQPVEINPAIPAGAYQDPGTSSPVPPPPMPQ